MNEERPQESLFDPMVIPEKPREPEKRGIVRIERAERNQMEMRMESLDDRIGLDHPVRTIWEFVERLDFEGVNSSFKSLEGGPGRSVKDRRILFALWLYGYSEGIGSARRIDALCRRDDAYRWLAGDVALNYHTIADFRSQNTGAIDDLFAQCLGVLMKENLIDPTRIAADGTKIRAKAKGSRFRREPTLRELITAAKEHLETVKKENESGDLELRVRASRERHACERVQKCENALATLASLRTEKKKHKPDKEPRVSVTEPEARIMKFGGSSAFHPAYNVQVASTLDTGVILAIEPIQDHGDWNGLQTLVPAVQKNTGIGVQLVVADKGYGSVTTLDYAETEQIALYTPEKEAADFSPAYSGGEFCRINSSWNLENKQITCPAGHTFSIYQDTRCSPDVPEFRFARRRQICGACPLDGQCFPESNTKKKEVRYRKRSEELCLSLKERMQTEEGKKLYRMRSQCELQNAKIKDLMHVHSFHVQGLRKARQESQLAAMAHNFKRWAALRSLSAA